MRIGKIQAMGVPLPICQRSGILGMMAIKRKKTFGKPVKMPVSQYADNFLGILATGIVSEY